MIRPLRRSRRVKDWEKGMAVMTPDGVREICTQSAAGREEYLDRTGRMSQRQGERCAICGWFFTDVDPATFDHQAGRTAGHKDERLLMEDGVTWRNAALCAVCNCAKGSRKFKWVDGNTRYIEAKLEIVG